MWSKGEAAVLFICLSLCFGTEITTFCVSDSGNDITNCPNLTTYALSADTIGPNSVFVLIPGTHTLESDVFLIKNQVNITIMGDNLSSLKYADAQYTYEYHLRQVATSVPYNQPVSVIQCSGEGGLDFYNVTNLYLANLTIIGCGAGMTNELKAAIRLTNVTNVILEGITVLNGSVVGTQVMGDSVVLRSSFVGSRAGNVWLESSLAISQSNFAYCTEGVLVQLGSYIQVNTSNFTLVYIGIHVEDPDSYSEFGAERYFLNPYSSKVAEVTVTGSSFVGCYQGTAARSARVQCSNCDFSMNYVGMFSAGSLVTMSNSLFSNNTIATMVSHSNVALINNQYFASGIYSLSSTLEFSRFHTFTNCQTSSDAGAIHLIDSIVQMVAPVAVAFDGNAAAKGGAFYVKMQKSRTPASEAPNCFFQITDSNSTSLNIGVSLSFTNNYAAEGGSVLYGDLTGCKLQQAFHYGVTRPEDVFKLISNIAGSNTEPRFASDPMTICFCRDNETQCQNTSQNVKIYPGQTVVINITSLDAYQNKRPTIILTKSENKLLDVHRSKPWCYSYIVPTNASGDKCNDDILVRLVTVDAHYSDQSHSLNLSLGYKSCPKGFECEDGICKCAKILTSARFVSSCDIDRQVLVKSNVSWLGNGVSKDTIGYYFVCPLVYCKGMPEVNLSDPDEQCSDNRSGVLCAECKMGFSLTFGRYGCRECTDRFLLLILVFGLLGLLLVASHFLLDLTISSVSIFGLLFYANIINSYDTIFFPRQVAIKYSGITDFFSVFVAWLSLDFGIDACFYNGMDLYAKVWLGFVFPAYIFILLLAIAFGMRYSKSLYSLCHKNVIPSIATLFLLSYSKVFVTAIMANYTVELTAFNATAVTNPRVSLFDVDDRFLDARQTVLFIFANALLLFVVAPYTLLLLLSQCLLAKSHWKVLSRIDRLKPFIDCSTAVLKDKYRFWAGVPFLARLVINSLQSNTEDIVLVAIVVIVQLMLVLTLYLDVHKHPTNLALDAFFYCNLILLAVMRIFAKAYRTESGYADVELAALVIGVGSAFAVFVAIVFYHVYRRIRLFLKSRTSPSNDGETTAGEELEFTAVPSGQVSHASLEVSQANRRRNADKEVATDLRESLLAD